MQLHAKLCILKQEVQGMKCKRSPLRVTRACLVVLVASLFFACSNESSGPPTPPPPPPFQPQTVVVQLGERGGATTLISTQAGGWTRNGQPFTSGTTITGENAASYRLALANGVWTAEFIQPDPEPLALGTSGDAVLLQAQEDGSYHLDGQPLTSGRVVDADNGNQYRLVRGSNGVWTAEFVPPSPQLLPLGTTGETRQVGRLEDGGYTIDGRALVAGEVIEARNGNRYTLALGADGVWTAVYVAADPQLLQLGTSGDPPLLVYRQENGTFRLDGEPLLGGRVVEASNGARYRLRLRPDGTWYATYVSTDVSIQLGSSGGTLILTPNEDGTWQRGSSVFTSGETVTGATGFEYLLTLGDDGWIVEPLPLTVSVPVAGADTTIALSHWEDGSYTYDNEPVASGDTVRAGESTYELHFSNNRWTAEFLQGEILVSVGTEGDSITLIKRANNTYEYDGRTVRSGSLVRSATTGRQYRLRFSNGVWSGSLYVPTVPGGGGGDPGVGTPPAAAENILDALPASVVTDGAFTTGAQEIQVNVSVDSEDYSAFRGSGRYEDDTFVESAIRAIDKILGPIESRGLADGSDPEQDVARLLIESFWGDVKTELDAIFGTTNGISFSSTPPQLSRRTDLTGSLRTLRDLKEALSDVARFKEEFQTQIAAASATGDQIFNTRKRVLALGASTNTRFGVISTLASTTNAATVAAGTGTYTTTGFAFSPLSATPAAELPSRGTARYSGRTWAVDDNQLLYSGAIELLASIGIERVQATVSDLRRTDNGARLVQGNKEVREIELPQINHDAFQNAGSFTSTANARIVYEASDGLFSATFSSSFDGQFVGSAAGQNAGTAVIGTWGIDTDDRDLEGSFGAERITTNAVTFPRAGTGLGHRYFPDSTSIDTTTDASNPALTIPNFDLTFPLSGLGSGTTKTDSTANERATIRSLRNTTFTRFGVWTLEDTSTTPATTTDTGLFAYGPLAATSFSDNPNFYPRRVDATYAGHTVAIDGSNNVYSGSYVLSVDWNLDPSTASTLTAVVSNLSRTFTIGGVGVSRIGFEQSFTGSTFSTSPTTIVEYTTGERDTETGTHAGAFVGNHGIDGPYGVIGAWSVTKDPDTIKGSFGADLTRGP